MSQYFDNVDLKSEIIKFKTKILGKEYSFFTDSGVFSKEKLDYGTRFLLETIQLDKLSGDILDVGCGYGVIDIILGKQVDANFEGIDVNLRAVSLAEKNALENQVKNVKFFISNCYENVNKKYNFIITNPPIRAGKKIVYEIVMDAKNYLKDNGELFIVIRKDQGAKSMLKDLEKQYNVKVLDKNKGFFVISCTLR